MNISRKYNMGKEPPRSFRTAFETFRRKHKLFKGKSKSLIDRELKIERKLRWVLNKDARILKRKQDFCEKGKREPRILVEFGGEFADPHKTLFDEIPRLIRIIDNQRGLIKRYFALEEKERKIFKLFDKQFRIRKALDAKRFENGVSSGVQSAITVMHTDANKLETAGVHEGNPNVQGAYGKLQAHVGLIQQETQAVDNFFDDLNKGMRVLQKWDQLLSDQEHHLSAMMAADPQVNKPIDDRDLENKRRIIQANFLQVSILVANEIRLLHLLLKDNKVKDHVLRELKMFSEGIELLESQEEAESRKHKTSKSQYLLEVMIVATFYILSEYLDDKVAIVGKGLDESIDYLQTLFEQADKLESILKTAEGVVNATGEVVDSAGDFVEDAEETMSAVNSALESLSRLNPFGRRSLSTKKKKKESGFSDSLREAEEEIREAEAGVREFREGLNGKADKTLKTLEEVEAFPESIHIGRNYQEGVANMFVFVLMSGVVLHRLNAARKRYRRNKIWGINEKAAKNDALKVARTIHSEVERRTRPLRVKIDGLARVIPAQTKLVANKVPLLRQEGEDIAREIQQRGEEIHRASGKFVLLKQLKKARRDLEDVRVAYGKIVGPSTKQQREAYDKDQELNRQIQELVQQIGVTLPGEWMKTPTLLDPMIQECKQARERFKETLKRMEMQAEAIRAEIEVIINTLTMHTSELAALRIQAAGDGEATAKAVKKLFSDFGDIEAKIEAEKGQYGIISSSIGGAKGAYGVGRWGVGLIPRAALAVSWPFTFIPGLGTYIQRVRHYAIDKGQQRQINKLQKQQAGR
jgi:hypothetical protein